MKTWEMRDPRAAEPGTTKVVSPVMVHRASTVTSILEAARSAGVKVLLEGGKVTGGDYADHAEVAAPVVLGRVTPETRLLVDWDGKEKTIAPALTEFFMPILVTMETPTVDDFLLFSVNVNPHDLATSLWTRDDAKLYRARRVLAGMLKENDGTDSALEWEEFGASGVGESGNTGVGDATTTLAMFCRRQKGRHLVL
jgi:acyl-CoA reductase-like NAD-dependent aldehyde dehydrogenase